MKRYGALIVLAISVGMLLFASRLCAERAAWSAAALLLVVAIVLAFQAPQTWREARRRAA